MPRTEYWADSGASILAPGGSIQRIGYDQTLYEEAVRVVILGEQPAEKREMAGTIPRSQEEAEGRAEKGKEAQGMEGYKTNKEDLATIVSRDFRFCSELRIRPSFTQILLLRFPGGMTDSLRL